MNYNAIMRIPRFYCPDISSDVLEIHDQKIIHHLIKVLRARQGQRVVLFDGNGKTFECEIKEIEKTIRTFSPNNKKHEENLIDALKIACRKFSKEKTGKKPLTNINLVRI